MKYLLTSLASLSLCIQIASANSCADIKNYIQENTEESFKVYKLPTAELSDFEFKMSVGKAVLEQKGENLFKMSIKTLFSFKPIVKNFSLVSEDEECLAIEIESEEIFNVNFFNEHLTLEIDEESSFLLVRK